MHNPDHRDIIEYYTEAGEDYRLWSENFNIHFGFYRFRMNPFDLESMLERMNREVIERLRLGAGSPRLAVDMGCGLGATARSAARALPELRVCGVTIVPWQLRRAVELTDAAQVGDRVRFVAADYTATPLASACADGVYALESSCYAPGLSKRPLVAEAYRILKPGGRFVVADAFLKTQRKMNPLTRFLYRAILSVWSLETWGEIHEFSRAAREAGFQDICVENISRYVTPSVLHAPVTMIRFAVRELIPQRGRIHRKRWGNMAATLPLLAFTLDRTRSGYFMVSATKPAA